MYRVIILSIVIQLFSVSPGFALEKGESLKLIGVYYFKPMYGHLHQNASKFSTSITTLTCGHPIKVYKKVAKKGVETSIFNKEWRMVKVGPYEGFLKIDFLSRRRVTCLQDQYPKFFEGLNLEITEMFYWGKLNDLYVRGKSSVK